MIHVYIRFNPLAIVGLRMQLGKKFSDEQVFMLLGAFDDRTDPYEILSNRPLNEDETQFLEHCNGVVSFSQTIDVKCSRCGDDTQMLLGSKHDPICDNCRNKRVWDVFLELADSDDPATPLGTIEAVSRSKALLLAAEKYNTPSHDLLVKEKNHQFVVDASTLPPAESRTCADCGDFIGENMGFQYNGRSVCAGCLP